MPQVFLDFAPIERRMCSFVAFWRDECHALYCLGCFKTLFFSGIWALNLSPHLLEGSGF